MADFISIHPEEWVGLIDGLYFSAMVSTVLPLFLPVVIFAIGLSLFIWLYRLERGEELTKFILWLVVSSVLLITVFKKTQVDVELSPIVVVNPQVIMSFKGVQQVSEENTFVYRVDASGAAVLLAIPDKIAALFFNLLDEGFVRKISKQTKTIPLDYLVCADPRYATALIQTMVLTEVFDLSSKEDQFIQNFQEKVEAFKICYEQDFKGDTGNLLGFQVTFDFSWRKFWQLITETGGGALGGLLYGKSPHAALLGAAVGFIHGASNMVEVKSGTDCAVFLGAYKQAAEEFASACLEEFLGTQLSNEEKKKNIETFTNIVLACVQNPKEDKSGFCSDLKNRSLSALEQAQKLSNIAKEKELGRSGIIGGLKDFLSSVISAIKSALFSLTYMGFNLKFQLLAKGQGIVLALLIGVFPFIVVLSIIPTGTNFINWPLLLRTSIAYFLVKLWLPLLYFIVHIAVHLFAGLSIGG
jgi:hypothetical protein